MTALSRKHSFDEVFDAQKVFRLLLTAAANPTRVVHIKEFADRLFGRQPEMLALAFTLLDNEVSHAVCGCDALSDDIGFLTLSGKVPTESADYIFVTDGSMVEAAIAAAKCGTLRDPHKSATVIVKNEGEAAHKLKFFGPGIDGTVEFAATETVKTAVEARDAQHYEYPQGIDLIFISADGELFALPRLVLKEGN